MLNEKLAQDRNQEVKSENYGTEWKWQCNTLNPKRFHGGSSKRNGHKTNCLYQKMEKVHIENLMPYMKDLKQQQQQQQ